MVLEVDGVCGIFLLTDDEAFLTKDTSDRGNGFVIEDFSQAIDGIRMGLCSTLYSCSFSDVASISKQFSFLKDLKFLKLNLINILKSSFTLYIIC